MNTLLIVMLAQVHPITTVDPLADKLEAVNNAFTEAAVDAFVAGGYESYWIGGKLVPPDVHFTKQACRASFGTSDSGRFLTLISKRAGHDAAASQRLLEACDLWTDGYNSGRSGELEPGESKAADE